MMTDRQLAMLADAQRASDEVLVLNLLTNLITDALTDMRDGHPEEVAAAIAHLTGLGSPAAPFPSEN
jgi:hypothetical protein